MVFEPYFITILEMIHRHSETCPQGVRRRLIHSGENEKFD